MTQEALKKMYQLLLTEPHAETVCFKLEAIAREALAQPPLPVQEPVAYDKTEMNSFVIDLYDKKMQEGKHGHYEIMFHVVHQAIKRVTLPLPVQPMHNLRRGDILRCMESNALCSVWSTSTTGQTLVKWSANDFGTYTAEQIGELFWTEPREAEPPPEWLLIKNILDEYGLQALDFVAEFKAAQQVATIWKQPKQQAPFSPEVINTTQTAWKMGYEAAKAEQQQAKLKGKNT